ncbi:MAG: NAD-dependent epimerase [Methylacidiphilales bacterium]|nr:NAD-dependent epimerase [Candidatus Methylacidiphilales bacterium]
MKVLVTGAAGFIGYHTAARLIKEGAEVLGLDNLSPYYDVRLKRARLEQLAPHKNFRFVEADLSDREAMESLFRAEKFNRVIHLAAQAGVRYSLANPHTYVQSNVTGFLHVLEGCRHHAVEHLVFASSSSVYGLNTRMPFHISDPTDHPISLYAATKKSNEMMAHAYSHLYKMPVTGLRFFTVYGPWGRPDMAPYLFTDAILHGKPIKVFNEGKMKRDFTCVHDVVEGVLRIMELIPKPNPSWPSQNPDPATSSAAYRLHNIGHNQPVELMRFIASIESALGKKAVCEFLPLQDGDVVETFANIDSLQQACGFTPKVTIEDGMAEFCRWYRSYHGC